MLLSSITLIKSQENTICKHNSYYCLNIFESHQRTCCDPFKSHKKLSVNKSLSLISLVLAKSLTGRGINIKPEQKFVICQKNEEDAEFLFLQLPWPVVSLFWLQREDCCFVPLDNILWIVSVPENSSSGRTYYFVKNDVKLTELHFSKWIKYTEVTY